MLTEAQVAKARTFPGCNDISAENAVDKLFASAESLQKDVDDLMPKAEAADKQTATIARLEGELATAKSALPKQLDTEILSLVAGSADTEMQAAVDSQSITPATAAELKAVLVGDPEKGQYNAQALSASKGKPLAVSVFSILRRNGRMPDTGNTTNAQSAPKIAPGAPGETIADITKKAREEATAYQNAQLAARGMK